MGQTELPGAAQARQQRPVLGLGGGRGPDRLGMLGQRDALLVAYEIANRGRPGRTSRTTVDVQHRKPRPGRPGRTVRSRVGLGQRSTLGIRRRSSFAALSPAPRRWTGWIAHVTWILLDRVAVTGSVITAPDRVTNAILGFHF